MFIIEGAVTVVIAFTAFFVLPNFPRTTKWLTEEERQLAVWRLEEDIGEDDWTGSQDQTFFHGLKLAFLDVKMYILVCSSHQVGGNLLTKTDAHALLYRRIRFSNELLPDGRANVRIQHYHLSFAYGTSLCKYPPLEVVNRRWD